MTGREIENLIKLLSRLPGLGPRSARRAVLQMLKKPETLMIPLADALHETAEAMTTCTNCGNMLPIPAISVLTPIVVRT